MLTNHQAQYYAHQLSRRTPANSLEKFAATLVDAQVDLNPHQVEAALFAFRSPLSKGAMLADEVGLGKTIEAGLVISQKWAEQKRRMLIIAPSSLRKQWSQELSDKFFLPSVVIEKKFFDQEIKRGNLNPFHQDDRIVICSYHFAKNKEDYLKQTNWDLAILDEAHKLRNVYRNDNQIGTSIRASLREVPKILLTATPLQNSLLELYGMVSIIDEQIFGDLTSFKDQYSRLDEVTFAELQQRLRPVCKRTLRRDVLEYIKYTRRNPLLQTYEPYEDEQRLYDMVSDYLQSENLYALPASQRSLMTLILRKLLASSSYAISGTLTRLALKLELMLDHGAVAGTNEFSEDYEALDDTADEWGGGDEQFQSQSSAEFETEQIKAELKFLKETGKLASSITRNAKGEALLKALETGFVAMSSQGANRKAMIFTESRRTQEYLLGLLEANGYAGEVVLFNGDNNTAASKEIYQRYIAKHKGTDRISGARSADQRAALVDHFRDTASIMIATEAAAEGINLQFCSLLVNYDLPWNPQRIEQRIGRCHRYGQKHDVVVVNFLNENNAADRRVYELLNSKFNLFDGVFGASDEVLGSIESGVDIEKRIAAIYQNCRTEAEIQAGFDALQEDMEEQINTRMSKTKQQLLEHFDTEVHEKLRISLEESRAYLNTWQNWLWQLTRFALADCATFADGGDYEFSLLRNPFSENEITTGRYRLGKGDGAAYHYRIGHPLAQSIIHRTRSRRYEPVQLRFNYSKAPQKISVLEPLIGQKGWLQLSRLSISSFEREDYLRVFAITENGQQLSQEQSERLFTLPAVEENEVPKQLLHSKGEEGSVTSLLEQAFNTWQSELISENMARNGTFFDEEMTKLDHWADDQKNALDLKLRQLEIEIKTRKTNARKLLDLSAKLKEQRAIKNLENERSQLRTKLFHAQDEIDERKEELLNTVEERMRQQVEAETIFILNWKLI